MRVVKRRNISVFKPRLAEISALGECGISKYLGADPDIADNGLSQQNIM